MSKTSIIFLMTMCILSFGAAAENISRGGIELTELEQAHASSWKLSVEEYQRYKQILSSPRAYFTPNLDKNPVLALAVEARTKQERKRYADLWVKIQYENNIKSFLWILEVDEAWSRNYPSVPRFTYGQPQAQKHAISKQGESMFKTATLDDVLSRSKKPRIKLYVKATDCGACVLKMKELRKTLDDGVISGIDVFFVDKPTNTDIAKWGVNQQLTVQDVNERKVITLNRSSSHKGVIPYTEEVN
ncbi:hypothetical protein ACODM8_15905 [Vibrio ostreicida]|uniref:hypothetical protein n=1 Tax=Vibrio ostreicida TaxID=526588 RepID=UPI003B5AB65F